MRIGAEVYHALKQVLGERGFATGVGDEGGFAPDLESSEAAIEAILEAAERAGHRDRIAIALDPAASEVFRDGVYRFEGREKTSAEMPGFWAGIVDRYPVVSIEDGAAEDDWDVVARAHASGSASAVQLVGDDIFVTNPARLQEGIDRGVANSILVKVNQIGTLTETIEAVELAHVGGLHRGHVPPLGRDRGRDDRRPRRRARHGSDQDGGAGALATAWRSTTSCCGSRRSWARGRSTRAGTPSRERRDARTWPDPTRARFACHAARRAFPPRMNASRACRETTPGATGRRRRRG